MGVNVKWRRSGDARNRVNQTRTAVRIVSHADLVLKQKSERSVIFIDRLYHDDAGANDHHAAVQRNG